MAKNSRTIPDDLDPQVYRCIPIYIPDDPQYAALLSGVLHILELVSSYSGDIDDKRTIAQIWRDICIQVSTSLWSNEQCGACSVEFQLVGCELQWRPDPLSSWLILGEICAPTPIVTISEPTPGNHLIEFDMDANGIPEDAVNISDGVDAAIPIVTISEPTTGNHLIEFDMDANGIPEDGVLISDGQDGVTAAPSGLTDDEKCNSALYVAAQIVQFAKDAAYESIVNGNTASAWWVLIKQLFDGSPFFNPSMAMLEYIQGLLDSYAVIEGKLNASESRLASLLYCDASELSRGAALANWQAEIIDGVIVTVESKNLIDYALQAVNLSQWNDLVATGSLQTGGDCTALCDPPPTVLEYDMSDVSAFSAIVDRYPFNDNQTNGMNTAVISSGIETQAYGTNNYKMLGSRLNVSTGDTWTKIDIDYDTDSNDIIYVVYGDGIGDPYQQQNISSGTGTLTFILPNWTNEDRFHFHSERHNGAIRSTKITRIEMTRL